MTKKQLALQTLLHAIAVTAYVVIVAFIISAGDEIFSKANQIQSIIAMLLLFTVSAAVTGLLVFGKPVYIYLEGDKLLAYKFLFFTIGWLFLMTIIFLAVTALLAG